MNNDDLDKLIKRSLNNVAENITRLILSFGGFEKFRAAVSFCSKQKHNDLMQLAGAA